MLSNVGMSLMTKLPLLRDTMLIVSLGIAALIAYQILRSHRPLPVRVTGALSIVLTIWLGGWSLLRFGM